MITVRLPDFVNREEAVVLLSTLGFCVRGSDWADDGLHMTVDAAETTALASHDFPDVARAVAERAAIWLYVKGVGERLGI